MKKARPFLWAMFLLYTVFLCVVLFFRHPVPLSFSEYVRGHVNLIPFHTIAEFASHVTSVAIVNLFGNLVLFLPMGFLLPALFPSLRRLWKTVLTIAVTVLLVEFSQLLLRVGVCDMDDLILNTAGSLGGYALFTLPPIRNFFQSLESYKKQV